MAYDFPAEDLYCDLCEKDGHTFSTCRARDDHFEEDI